ncbi:helix-turn-helix domain-containing protein [Komagataeibacter intermedius]|uniref:helix-turn-helix domain-containing protein n=1 Tax=Komagataeibacter intermedius TaxID=66229 RepID=UPI003B43C28D
MTVRSRCHCRPCRANARTGRYLSASSHSKEELLHALRLNGGNKSRTAQQLGMTARQLHYRLKLFDVA